MSGWIAAAEFLRAAARNARAAAVFRSVPPARMAAMQKAHEVLLALDREAMLAWFDVRMAGVVEQVANRLEARGQKDDTPVEVVIRWDGDPDGT